MNKNDILDLIKNNKTAFRALREENNYNRLDLTNVTITTSLKGLNLQNIDFSGSEFLNPNFTNCNLINANFSNCIFKGKTIFANSIM